MNKAKPTTERPNVYQIVTDRIIASLKDGIIPGRSLGRLLRLRVVRSPETFTQASHTGA
ncbi:MAG TPA: hypothetical protein VK638_10955 [Edaphobacter sp.]|nr:hypothetical protein [Edaphobacter sp.]